jgi:peptidoglycan hydrolase-like protein with peptidoglycan-binding domain
MALKCFLFAGNADLEASAVENTAHILRGAQGAHVGKIQAALLSLDEAQIDAADWNDRRYGPSTEAAVLAYKKKREIINRAYQTTADAIVGKMTIAALDDEMFAAEKLVDRNQLSNRCATPFAPLLGNDAVSKLRASARPNGVAIVGAPTVRSVTAPGPKPGLIVGGDVNEGGSSHLGGINYQMIPLGRSRKVFGDTAGKQCQLLVPDNVSVALNGVVVLPTGGVVAVPAQPRALNLVVTGNRPGKGVMMIRAAGESTEQDVKRDALLSVKDSFTVRVTGIRVVDAKKRQSQYSAQEVANAMTPVISFFLRWCNIIIVDKGVVEEVVDEDLREVFDHKRRVGLEQGDELFKLLGKQRVFGSSADRLRGPADKVIYYMWKLPDNNLIGATFTNRVFLQNYGKDTPKLILAIAHELVHALGQPEHSTEGGNIMFTPFEGVGARMDHVDIELINPN